MGGYMMAQVAAKDARLRAVVLAGTPGDAIEQLNWEYRAWGPLAQWPAVWAIRHAGMRPEEQRPIDVVRAIAPRPLLVVGGSDDHIVPMAMTRALFDAAAAPKDLLVVAGAHHGDYASILPDDFGARLVAFYRAGLR
jgi:pimeloyl-ACP methyl ester carboxylesterase